MPFELKVNSQIKSQTGSIGQGFFGFFDVNLHLLNVHLPAT